MKAIRPKATLHDKKKVPLPRSSGRELNFKSFHLFIILCSSVVVISPSRSQDQRIGRGTHGTIGRKARRRPLCHNEDSVGEINMS